MAARDVDPMLAMALLGLQDPSGLAGSVALTLAMERRRGVADADDAKKTASRYGLSADLIPLVPREPGFLASAKTKSTFQSAILGLKRVDEMASPEREEAIGQILALLGHHVGGESDR
jgi:hypothetical protein